MNEQDLTEAVHQLILESVPERRGYPPDKQEKAALTVLEQAEVLCRDWAA